MEYKILRKIYYKNKEEYESLYQNRFNSENTIRLGLLISGYEAFVCVNSEIQNLIVDILRTDKAITKLKYDIPIEAINQYKIKCLVDEIYMTNNIEGVYSTRKEIKKVFDDLEENEYPSKKRFSGLVNHYKFLHIRDIPLKTPEDIRRIYDLLVLDEVVENDKNNKPDGDLFRKYTVDVMSGTQNVIHTGVFPEKKIYEYIEKTIKIYENSEIDLLVRTAIFHYLFGYIHPFYDGNGRVARFISSYMICHDLDELLANRISYTLRENIHYYYEAFKICNDKKNRGDLTPFVIFFLEMILEAERKLLDAISIRKDKYNSGMKKIALYAEEYGFKADVQKLCEDILISTLFTRTGANRQGLMRENGIKSPQTLTYKLTILNKADLIEKHKDGNVVFYKLKPEMFDF